MKPSETPFEARQRLKFETQASILEQGWARTTDSYDGDAPAGSPKETAADESEGVANSSNSDGSGTDGAGPDGAGGEADGDLRFRLLHARLVRDG